ncbi:MAG: hypothetical protein ABH829_04845 [archaeon]
MSDYNKKYKGKELIALINETAMDEEFSLVDKYEKMLKKLEKMDVSEANKKKIRPVLQKLINDSKQHAKMLSAASADYFGKEKKYSSTDTALFVAELKDGLVREVKAADMYLQGTTRSPEDAQKNTLEALIKWEKQHAKLLSDLIDEIK